MINMIFGIFGFELSKKKELKRKFSELRDEGESLGYVKGQDDFKKRVEKGVWYLRDITHNLPGRFIIGTDEESKFLSETLNSAWQILDEKSDLLNKFAISETLEKSLLGCRPMMSGGALNKGHFERARQGSTEDALYITKVIMSKYTEGKSPSEIIKNVRLAAA